MNCPFCGDDASTDQTIVESRQSAAGVHRRRRCAACDEAFTTYEQIQRAVVMVVKKDGRREEFQREKLLGSLRIAARKRALPAGSLEAVVEDGEIASRVIGEMGITRLKELDPIAYIRYASIYHQFVSLEHMLEELQRIALDPSLPAPEQARLFDASEEAGSDEPGAPLRLEDHRAAAR